MIVVACRRHPVVVVALSHRAGCRGCGRGRRGQPSDRGRGRGLRLVVTLLCRLTTLHVQLFFTVRADDRRVSFASYASQILCVFDLFER